MLSNKNGAMAIKLLLAIHSLDSKINSLKPATICKIFEANAYEKNIEGIKSAVLMFFKSLFIYENLE